MKSFCLIMSTLCALSVTPLFVNAAAQVNYLNIDGDAVHFSIAEAKTETSPSCAVAQTNERFAFSLKTDAGRAMYSLLITAMAAKQDLAVESAQDCADVVGIERASGISIAPAVVPSNTTSGGGKDFYVYKGDGITKLGPIKDIMNYGNIYYFDSTKTNQFSSFPVSLVADILYFSALNCEGTVYSTISNSYYFSHPYFNNDKLMKNGARKVYDTLSQLDINGQCNNIEKSAYYYITADFNAINPVCGDKACIIKHE